MMEGPKKRRTSHRGQVVCTQLVVHVAGWQAGVHESKAAAGQLETRSYVMYMDDSRGMHGCMPAEVVCTCATGHGRRVYMYPCHKSS